MLSGNRGPIGLKRTFLECQGNNTVGTESDPGLRRFIAVLIYGTTRPECASR
jgi:hypothetical protein